ncbi:hypothetical protein HK097_004759, partial [Rhizophlyctis rosea]
MGGKALKELTTLSRLAPQQLQSLQSRVLPIVNKHFIKAGVPHYLPTKESFGDLDILVAGPKSREGNPIDDILSHFKPKHIARHGNITSFALDDFQVDLIWVPYLEYECAYGFLSWGDLGAMTGLIAKKL